VHRIAAALFELGVLFDGGLLVGLRLRGFFLGFLRG